MQYISIRREMHVRWRRYVTAIAGLAVGVCLLLVIHALSGAYKEAARIPLQDIGADISIQRNGDVPEELNGVVFPCSAVTIRQEEIEAVRRMDGVRAVAQSVLLWAFQEEKFTMLLGIEPDTPLGPGRLKQCVTKGEFLKNGLKTALLDESYARDAGLDVGDTVTVAGHTYPIAGIVAASRLSRMVPAHVFLPIEEAQRLASESKGIQSVSPFSPKDANVLYVVADQDTISQLGTSLRELLGKKAAITTPETFTRKMGTIFALSDRFSLATGLIVLLVTFLLVLKTVSGGIQERAREIAVLKCLGWGNSNISKQITAEVLAQCLLAAAIGVLLGGIACWILSFQTLDILIPWEMSPSPHFLPGGSDPVIRRVHLPMHISMQAIGISVALAVGAGGIISLICTGRIVKVKPSEVLRHE